MKKILFVFYLLSLSATFIIADEIDFTHDGWEREAYLYKPSCIPDNVPDDFESVPLVLMFHGLGGVGADNYGFTPLAEDSCFIVAFPSGLFNTWNVGPEASFSHDIDDNSYVAALIDSISSKYPVDTNKIYGTGHSMGGGFTNHLACTSTEFTALGSSGGWVNSQYDPGTSYSHLCDPLMDGYYIPTIHSHGTGDQIVPVEWGKHAAFAASAKNHCDEPLGFFNEIDWSLYFYYGEVDLEEFNIVLDGFFATADTLEHNGAIEHYQWTNGCHTEPNTEIILLPNYSHAWHQPWNSPISTPLEHWNFFRQFSKDKMGPVLDSLTLPLSVTLDDDYYVNVETTPIGILAIDNHSVAFMTISFSGFINVEGFDLTLDFDTSERLFYGDYDIVLDPAISTDSYETTGISIVDHDGNEKVYDSEMLQELGLYQQMAVINNVTTSSTSDGLSLPETYALHQNYPNPFNPETNIDYDLADESMVSLKVYDTKGILVKTLLNENQSSGYKTVKWDGTSDLGQKVSAGLYLYRIQMEGFTTTKKMALLK